MQAKNIAVFAAIVAFTVALGAVLSTTRTGHRPSDGRIQLTVGGHYNAEWIKQVQELCDEFSRNNPKIVVTVVGVPGNYYEKVLVMMAGRTAPDLMWMGKGFAQFASRDAFLDVEDQFDIDPADYYMRAVDSYRFNGRLQGFPYAGDFAAIIYNVDILEAAGVDPPHDDWTVDDFRRTAQRLTRRDTAGDVVHWGYRGIFDEGAFGADFLNEDMTRHRLDKPEWLNFFNFILAMKYEDRSMPTQSHVQRSGMLTDLQAFMQGKVAMISGGTNHFPTLRETIKDFRWDIVTMPRGVRPSCESSTGGFAIWKHTPHPQQAVGLLQFLASPAGQLCLAGTGVPSHRQTARRFVETMPAPPRRVEAMLQSMECLNPAPRHPRLNELERAIDETMRLILERKQTPEQALQMCGKQFEKILSREYTMGR